MGDYSWGGDNGECFQGDGDEVGGSIASKEWLVWRLTAGCGVVGKMGEGFGDGR